MLYRFPSGLTENHDFIGIAVDIAYVVDQAVHRLVYSRFGRVAASWTVWIAA